MAVRTSTTAAADRGPSMYPPVGASGRPVMAVAGVDAVGSAVGHGATFPMRS